MSNRHRHIGPSLGVMVRGANKYTCPSRLVSIDGTLINGCYISDVLKSMAQPFIRALRNATFQQIMYDRL